MKKILLLFLFNLMPFLIYPQWQMMNSPFATPDIRKVAYHPDGYIFAISDKSEVFRSVSNSNSWTKIATLPCGISFLATGPNGILYAGTSCGVTAAGYYYSTNLGINWQKKDIFIGDGAIRLEGGPADIEFDSLGHIIVCGYYMAGNQNGIWISTNNGNTWNRYLNGLNGESLVGLEKDNYGNLYTLTVWGQIYKSTDSGQTWQLKTDLLGVAFDIDIDSNNNLFVVSTVSIDTTTQSIYKSSDLGNNWNLIGYGLIFNLVIDKNNTIYAHNFHDIRFSSNGGNSWQYLDYMETDIYDIISFENNIYIGTAKGLQKSPNLGINWSLCFKYSDRFVIVNDLRTEANNKILIASTEGLFISQNNGIDWDSIITTNVILLKRDQAGNIYASSGKLYRSSDDGASWIQCGSMNNINNIFINDSNYVFIVTSDCAVLKSTNNGVSWDTISSNIFHVLNIYCIAQNSLGSIFISTSYTEWGPGGHYTVYELKRSNNNGTTWTTIKNGLNISNIYFIDSTMYLTTFNKGILKSTNNGLDVIPINNGLSNFNVKSMLFTPSNVLICATSNGIYRSLSNGDYWYPLSISGLISNNINNVYYSYEGNLYACTDNGIGIFTGELPVEFLSFTIQTNAENVLLQWLTSTETNNKGFEIGRKTEKSEWRVIGFREGKGTTTEPQNYDFIDDLFEVNGNRISYRLKQIDFNGTFTYSKEIEIELLPNNFYLSQNYPNPFNPSTKISYTVACVGARCILPVQLKVYDVLGNAVATLVDEYKPAGSYEVEFSARGGQASGVYFYQLKAGDFTETKKMILLR